MKRIVIFWAMTVFLMPGLVRAQLPNEDLSEVFEGNGIRFNYPAGWRMEAITPRMAVFQNMEFDPLASGTGFPAGAVEIRISGDLVQEGYEDNTNLSEDEPEFALGYFTGVLITGDGFNSVIDGEEVQSVNVGSLTRAEIGSYDAIFTTSTVRNDILVMILVEEGEFVAILNATSPAGEIGQWLKLIFEMATSIEMSDEFAFDSSEGQLNSDSFTSALESLLIGNPDPVKALACEDVHGEIEEAAEAFVSIAEEDVEMTVICEVGVNQASCELTASVGIEGQEPLEVTETVVWEVVDGMICQEISD
jgi:hypothetical protein